MGAERAELDPASLAAAGLALLLLAQAARVEASPITASAAAIPPPLLTLWTIANRPSVCLTSPFATAALCRGSRRARSLNPLPRPVGEVSLRLDGAWWRRVPAAEDYFPVAAGAPAWRAQRSVRS
jgi:hypothetical protein